MAIFCLLAKGWGTRCGGLCSFFKCSIKCLMLLRLLTLGSPGRWDSRPGVNNPVARTGLGGAGMLLAGFSWKYLIVLYDLGRAVRRIDFPILGRDQISKIQLILGAESCQCQCSKVQCSLLQCSAQLFQSCFPITNIATYRLNLPRGQFI